MIGILGGASDAVDVAVSASKRITPTMHGFGLCLWARAKGGHGLRAVVDELAAQLGTPRFDPHLTLACFVTESSSTSMDRALQLRTVRAALAPTAARPLRLRTAACLPITRSSVRMRRASATGDDDAVFFHSLELGVEPVDAAHKDTLVSYAWGEPHVSLAYRLAGEPFSADDAAAAQALLHKHCGGRLAISEVLLDAGKDMEAVWINAASLDVASWEVLDDADGADGADDDDEDHKLVSSSGEILT